MSAIAEAKLGPWNDLAGIPDLGSTLREGERKEFMTALGWAEPLFCASCSREIGYVSAGTPAIQICGGCIGTHGGLPLKDPPNVAIVCAGCARQTASIPREMLGKVIYYCESCERRMGVRPPLSMIAAEEERMLKITRTG